MRVNFGEQLEIQDSGNHAASTLISLGILLAGAVNVTPDPKRAGFYEVQSHSTVYYIHVSPVTGIIYLLATWENVAVHSLKCHSTSKQMVARVAGIKAKLQLSDPQTPVATCRSTATGRPYSLGAQNSGVTSLPIAFPTR